MDISSIREVDDIKNKIQQLDRNFNETTVIEIDNLLSAIQIPRDALTSTPLLQELMSSNSISFMKIWQVLKDIILPNYLRIECVT